jgi:hypothetical protein
MLPRRSRCHGRAKLAFVWGVLFFLLFQISAAVSVERWLPEARDPEFTQKLTHLQNRLHEAPGSPLVLMLGSSRTAVGFKAGSVQVTQKGKPAVVFNLGVSGGGPLLELLCLRRLLDSGIRPDLLFVEILPAFLNQAGKYSLEEWWLQGGRLRYSELGRLRQYHGQPERMVRRWWRCRLLPWTSLHRSVQAFLVPSWSEPPRGPGIGKIDEHGWEAHFVNGITEEERRHYLELARRQYLDSMDDFQPAAGPLEALNALFELCRRKGIPVALVLMPEGTGFRALYPPPVLSGLTERIQRLSKEWQLPLIDARSWLTDRELWDAHHCLPSGASHFTERLAAETIGPILEALPKQSGREAVRLAVRGP